MTSEEILAAVAELAREKLDFDGSLRREMRLVEDLGLDSILVITLATAVEDRFQICIDESEEAGIVTVADLVGVVEHKLAS